MIARLISGFVLIITSSIVIWNDGVTWWLFLEIPLILLGVILVVGSLRPTIM